MMRKSGRATTRLAMVIATGALSLSACDVPTAMPHWDTTWALPVDALEMTTESLLPSAITLTPDSQAFELRIDGVDIENRLTEICSACQPLAGTAAPKPEFTSVMEGGVSLPAALVSAQIVGGHARIELFHDLGFDPIRPSSTARGSIQVIVTSAGDTLATETILGEREAFPSGTRKLLTLPYSYTELRDTVLISVTITSPAGDPVEIDDSRSFELNVAQSLLLISEAAVKVQDLEVVLDETSIEVIGGEGMINRIRSGALLLEIDNPFQVTGSFSITLSAPGISVARQLALDTGASKRQVEFTGAELQSILESEAATLSATGVVTANGGTVTIRPAQVLKAKSRFDLVVSTKDSTKEK